MVQSLSQAKIRVASGEGRDLQPLPRPPCYLTFLSPTPAREVLHEQSSCVGLVRLQGMQIAHSRACIPQGGSGTDTKRGQPRAPVHNCLGQCVGALGWEWGGCRAEGSRKQQGEWRREDGKGERDCSLSYLAFEFSILKSKSSLMMGPLGFFEKSGLLAFLEALCIKKAELSKEGNRYHDVV